MATMRKRAQTILNIVIGSAIGVFAGHALFVLHDYRAHPALYAAQSAPWYMSICFYGIVSLFVILAAAFAKMLTGKIK